VIDKLVVVAVASFVGPMMVKHIRLLRLFLHNAKARHGAGWIPVRAVSTHGSDVV